MINDDHLETIIRINQAISQKTPWKVSNIRNNTNVNMGTYVY